MGNLGEGVRAFDAIAGNAALAADVNGLQDQIADAFEARILPVPMSAGIAAPGANPWVYQSTHNWISSTLGGWILHFPVHARKGEIITEIHTVVAGDAANTGGTINLKSKLLSTAATVTTEQAIDASNAFGVAAATLVSVTGLSIGLDSTKQYYVEYTGSTALTAPCYVHSLYFQMQFTT